MKGAARPLAFATLATAVSAYPQARGLVYENAVELEVPSHFQSIPKIPNGLHARQLPTGPPPAPPADLPYAFGLSSE